MKTLLNSFYWVNKCRQLQLTRLVLLERMCKNGYFCSEQLISRILLLNFRYRGSFPSDYVPTLDNDTFSLINTHSSNMQGKHWIMIAKFRHELLFADSLGCKGYSFVNKNNNHHYKQMMPAPLQSHLSVCGFCTIYAAFHLFKFRQEGIAGVHDVKVHSFIDDPIKVFIFSIVNVQAIQCLC